MKKINIIIIFLFSLKIYTQNNKLPKGWDLITLDGKKAYMNLITGSTTYVLPTRCAEKPKIAIELDPTIKHKVKKGETIYSIAIMHNISQEDIYKLNTQIDTKKIKVGDSIIIGYDKSKESKIIYKIDENKYTHPSNNSQHFVKKGETLYSIAHMYGISIIKLKKLNNLTSNNVKIGQKLILE